MTKSLIHRSLYDLDEKLNSDGSELDQETYNANKSIYQKYIDQGFSAREIAHIMLYTIFDLELMHCLKNK